MISGADKALGSGPRETLGERIVAHTDIVLALAGREFRARFGQNSLGYAWSFVAPLVWIAATYLSFNLFGRSSPVYTDTITFIISGIVPYAAFRYTVTAVGRVNNAVRGLLIFPSVRHEHAVATAALLEFANMFVVFGVMAAANYLLFGNGELDNFPHFVGGLALAWGLGASYGYLVSALGRFNPTIQQFLAVILRPMFFLSAVFFTANELPESLLNVLTWNPVLHAIEITRDGMLFHYQSRVASPLYVMVWIVALTGSALMVSASKRS